MYILKTWIFVEKSLTFYNIHNSYSTSVFFCQIYIDNHLVMYSVLLKFKN